MSITVLLMLLPQFILALDLQEPNVCSRWESYIVSFLESYAHTYNQVYYTRCTDILNLFKCTQHRVGYRLGYRQATRTAYRHRPQCCHGFYNKNDTCIRKFTHVCLSTFSLASPLSSCRMQVSYYPLQPELIPPSYGVR
uniref:EMI domain-containing protein n=1 Tax=Eptatretus burgeri TaxID=7764 RepID=A0A8C4Q3S1_EPTBU